MAVAFNPAMEYVALHASTELGTATYIVAEALLSTVIVHCNLMSGKNPTEPASQSDIVALFPGSKLEGTTFQHPFLDRKVLGVTAPYVTADQGTGAVHTAPAHGVDDFYTGQRYEIPAVQYVDNAGKHRNTADVYSHQTVQPYEDLTVFKSNPVIIELLKEKGALLSATHFEHSYPHCWRCHNPIIVRATEQWFIGMETPMISPNGTETTFRQRALDEIKKVVWDPAWGQERISNMIATRPDWCISRQRIWGVPIAVFLCEKCHAPLNDKAINKSIVDLFRKEGADAWYTHDVSTLLPPNTACPCGSTEFRKEMDILDVWFESGSSWHAVLDVEPELHFPADLYTEGGDQHRGWFHSSLLCSVAVRDKAPYKMVATSGWTLDEQGRAFSKSLGNGVDPVDIAKRLGGEIVRLWVASVDFREDVAASENLMQRVSDNYRKLRNTLRFLLGNLHDFDPATNAIQDFAKLEPLDQYILARLAEVNTKIRAAYEAFEFHRAYHALNEFVNTDFSALYLDVLKDRLYTFAPNAPARRSAQTALWRIAEALTRLIAPILSFTADEVWDLLPKVENREPSVHLALFTEAEESAPTEAAFLPSAWAHLLKMRDAFQTILASRPDALLELEQMRQSKRIGKGLDANVRLVVDPKTAAFLRENFGTAAFAELFGVSHVTIEEEDRANIRLEVIPASGSKCARCWRYTEDVGNDPNYPTVCLRCADALAAIQYLPYTSEGTEAHA